MKQLHAYITTKHYVSETGLQASATVASTRVHQPAETASDPLKHELQNTRLQASASANAMNPATQLIGKQFPSHEASSRVHQSALKPTSDNILTKAKLYRFHAVESVTVLDLDQRLIKFYQVDFST